MGKLFDRGYETFKEEADRREEQRANQGKKIFDTIISDGEEAPMLFLTTVPVKFEEHSIKTYSGGKERFEARVCGAITGNVCLDCEDNPKTSLKGAYLVYNGAEYMNKENKKVAKGLQFFKAGIKVTNALGKMHSKYGLDTRWYTISRTGKQTDTTYMVDRDDEKIEPLTPDDILEMLPDQLKPMYDGTVDSLYDIVEEQIIMRMSPTEGGQLEQVTADQIDEEDEVIGSKPSAPPARRGALAPPKTNVKTMPEKPAVPGRPKLPGRK